VDEKSIPSDMTTGTSAESTPSEPSRMPLAERENVNDMWNVAIRPHYSNLREAIHRMGDVSTLVLFKEPG